MSKKQIEKGKKRSQKVNDEIHLIRLELENEKLRRQIIDFQNTMKHNSDQMKLEQDLHNVTRDILKKKENEITLIQKQNQELMSQNNKELEELNCVICTQIIIQPSVTSCGHIYCQICIATWLKDHMKCPTCRSKVAHVYHACQLNELITLKTKSFSLQARADIDQRRLKNEEEIRKLKEANNVLLNITMNWNLNNVSSIDIVNVSSSSDESFSEQSDSSFILSD